MTTREIDERIANVLRLLAKHWGDGHPAYVLGRVVAELRAAEPDGRENLVRTDVTADKTGTFAEVPAHPYPAPPPSLVERFKAWHMGRHDDCLHCDVADALEAAQAEAAELRDWRRVGRESADKLSAEFNRVRELEAQLSVAQADTRRLDALEAHGTWQFHGPHEIDDDNKDRWFDSVTEGSDYSPTLRVAIDRALAATMERKPK